MSCGRENSGTPSPRQALATPQSPRYKHTQPMAYLFFVDESGLDRKHCPYEVLAGVAVEDSRLWMLISQIREAELAIFGRRYPKELKAKLLLDSATYKLANNPAVTALTDAERVAHCRSCLDKGEAARDKGLPSSDPTRLELVSLGRSRLIFVQRVLELCGQGQAQFFASIVDCAAPRPSSPGLRKDYSYLFERFYTFLDDTSPSAHGIVVFDEVERSKSHILIDQMAVYFQRTAKGRVRAARILPEPLFVHSDLTTMIMVADLLAYLVVFGVRIAGMERPARPELRHLADAVLARRFKSDSGPHRVWGFKLIQDLRPRSEQNPKGITNDADGPESI